MNYTLIFISYSVFLTIYFIGLAYPLRKGLKISGMLVVRSMYMLIYSIVPLVTFYFVNTFGIDGKTAYLDLSDDGIWQLFLFGIWGVVGYISLETGYRINIRVGTNKKKNDSPKVYYMNALWYASIVMSIIGLIALFVWTYPFGGPIKMFEYGSVIRSGKEVVGVTNSYGFMKQFVPLAKFSTVICFGLILENNKLRYWINFVVAFCISLVYSIANDGRAPFLMFFVSLLLLRYLVRNRQKNRKKLKTLPLLVICVLGYLFITNIYTITGLITGESSSGSTSGVGSFIYDEFSWVVRNPQAVHDAHKEGNTFLIGKEILSGIVSWFPSRFRPEWLPRLEKINSQYWYNGEKVHGGKPPDIITTGIYTFSYLGIVLIPMAYGMIVKAIDRFFMNRTESVYYDILFVQLVYQFAKTVAYCDFALVALNIFYIVIGHMIVLFFNRQFRRRDQIDSFQREIVMRENTY